MNNSKTRRKPLRTQMNCKRFISFVVVHSSVDYFNRSQCSIRSPGTLPAIISLPPALSAAACTFFLFIGQPQCNRIAGLRKNAQKQGRILSSLFVTLKLPSLAPNIRLSVTSLSTWWRTKMLVDFSCMPGSTNENGISSSW